jgi:hypothetical protein
MNPNEEPLNDARTVCRPGASRNAKRQTRNAKREGGE